MRAPLEWRFWSKVRIAPGCWEWVGCKCSDGYGNFHADKRMVSSHRTAYELLVGPIPKGLMVDHTCGNRSCVNPSHMRLCINRQNACNRHIHSNNKSGLKGVHASLGRWRASIRVDGKLIHLGYHDTKELAHAAYCAAALIHHGEFANFGEAR